MTNATDALRDFDEALAWVRHRMKTVPAGRFLVQYDDVIRAALATPAGSASGGDDALDYQMAASAEAAEVDRRGKRIAALQAEVAQLQAALAEARRDAERLDYLDQLNAALNAYYGTSYGWELILSPNIVRLMSGAHTFGFVGDIDLNDAALGKRAHKSCRAAIDAAMGSANGQGDAADTTAGDAEPEGRG